MEIKKIHWMGIAAAVIILVVSYFFAGAKSFPLFAGIAILIGIVPFISGLMMGVKTANEKEEMFLEFSRNLVESVKTGTPISKSIINMRDKDYRSLTIHIQKLANQISLGIPLNTALTVFARDVKNKSIARTLTLIGQAEKAGGEIGEILEAVAGAVSMGDKLKKERKAAISTLVAQGYIIFLVFIVIILVMQFQILPIVSGISGVESISDFAGPKFSATATEPINQSQISNAFLYLILVQGFFTGFVIGKLSEGSIKAGVKHSFGLMFLSFLVSAAANALLG